MLVDPYIAEAAALIGNPARAAMLAALKDDGSLTASELARVAGVAPQTASGHLVRLVACGLVARREAGRHRFFRLASERVAEVIEALEALAVIAAPRHRPRRADDDALRVARACYDHLAGTVGVDLAEALVARGWIKASDDGFAVTSKGRVRLGRFGVDVVALERGRRRLATRCLDWSEHRPHVGGALGAALFARLADLGWIERARRSRAVTVTRAGRAGLAQAFGLSP